MLLAAQIRLVPDWTIFLQIGIFLSVVFALNALLFKPLLKLIDRRKAFTSDASQEALRLNTEAEQLEVGRHEVLGMALKEAQAERARRTAGALREADKIISEARATRSAVISASLISIESAEKSIVEEMDKSSNELADRIVAKLKE
jgi:F-type H+-transporting ATPase subunit b